MDAPRVIGLYSSVPQSGKSTVATYMQATYGYSIISLAAPLKSVIRTFLHANGLQPSEINYHLYEAKEAVIPEIGVSARHLLQTLGTEWGRTCIRPDIWVDMWKREAQGRLAIGTSVICDDVRFIEEARAVKELGGELWQIVRPGTTYRTSHASEGGLDGLVRFDRTIHNDGSIHDLHWRIDVPCTAA